ncbi:hypothetical protein VTN00DRAFT_1750 [Thermoascus crustaceus]|uniref:uncharacterized protein n=1 Tax=Thermoascus crustaceus TaxID=5088 RepID=UPI00374201FE
MATHSKFDGKTEASDVAAAFADQIRGKTILVTGLIREAAATVVGYAEPTIDIVINNAGVMNIPKRTLSPAGVELHLATNHLGHFLFVNLTKAKLSGARIVNLTSNGHALSPIRFSDYNFDKMEIPEEEQPARAACEAFGVPWGVGYLPPIAYGQSKTANILHAIELSKRFKSEGIAAFSVNPGDSYQAVATILVAALDPKLKESPGAYLDNCQITEAAPFAMNEIAAQRLWDLSERLTAERS